MFSAVIDNTALVYVTQLHGKRPFFEQFKNIFHTLYVPLSVKNEYEKGLTLEPNRSWLLDRLNPEQGFFRLCTSYDSFTLLLVDGYKGMDKGESESYAQFKKISAQVIISDDKAFTKAIAELDRGIKVYSTLHLICWLEVLLPGANPMYRRGGLTWQPALAGQRLKRGRETLGRGDG